MCVWVIFCPGTWFSWCQTLLFLLLSHSTFIHIFSLSLFLSPLVTALWSLFSYENRTFLNVNLIHWNSYTNLTYKRMEKWNWNTAQTMRTLARDILLSISHRFRVEKWHEHNTHLHLHTHNSWIRKKNQKPHTHTKEQTEICSSQRLASSNLIQNKINFSKKKIYSWKKVFIITRKS